MYSYLFCRVSLICSCNMYLALFPMDEQTCHLNVASCKYILKAIQKNIYHSRIKAKNCR